HGVPDETVTEEIAHGGRRFGADELLRFLGRGRDVRGRYDLRQLGERPIRRRLAVEDVECGAADDATLDGTPERVLVDQFAACRIDQPNPRPAVCEPFVVEQVPGPG